MKLVDVLRDDNQRRRFIFAVPRPLRERMIEEHGSDKAVIA